MPSLAFAVGVYLPLVVVDRRSSSAAWCAGWSTARAQQASRTRNLTEEQLAAEGDKSPGVLMASGYIAGGAIAGIVIAFMAGVMTDFDTALTAWAAKQPVLRRADADLLSLIPFAAIAVCCTGRAREGCAR